MKKGLLFLFAFAFLTCCRSSKDAMNAWLGHSKEDVIAHFGKPARDVSDGRTGEILVFANEASKTGQNVTSYDYKIFYFNNEGKVYSWFMNKEKTPPEKLNLNTYKRY